jgi:3-oxoacyl-[acyl-carrier-protein] synthase-1
MMTGVGLDAPSACAAIRCGIDGFAETQFTDSGGEWIIGCQVPLDPPVRGRQKLVHLAASAVGECLSALEEASLPEIPALLCVAETTRPGRIAGQDHSLLAEVQQRLGVRFRNDSTVLAAGRIGGVKAVQLGSRLIEQGAPYCLVVGVDTFLVPATLAYYEDKGRLLTSSNSNGFLPGEAGAAVLLGPLLRNGSAELGCLGVGFGYERAGIESEEPLRADGLAEAIRAALAEAGTTFDDVYYRLTDCNGEQYAFKEAALALSRTMRQLKPEFDIWHPADCIGEVGAAIVPSVLAVAHSASVKDYSPGPGAICHFGNDDGQRAAIVLRYQNPGVS